MKIRDGLVRKGLVLSIILLFVGASVVPHVGSEKIELELSNLSTSTRQNVVYVNNDYNETTPTWNVTHFDNIQAGVNAVNESGIVYVCNGTYYENVVINKKLTLMGIDEDEWGNDNFSIIDGMSLKDVVNVIADNAIISGFTIQNCSGKKKGMWYLYAGIHLRSDSNTIHGNNISFNKGVGIYLNVSSRNTINENLIRNNTSDGIALYPGSSHDNNIINNIIQYNGETGIWATSSSGNKFENNVITHNVDGIFLHLWCTNNRIHENTITDSWINISWGQRSGCGIILEIFSHSNYISFNKIQDNAQYGAYIRFRSPFNTFWCNDFINNQKGNAFFDGSIFTLWRENYWDDWVGLENPNKEWWPYIIWGKYGVNFDRYPYYAPWDP